MRRPEHVIETSQLIQIGSTRPLISTNSALRVWADFCGNSLQQFFIKRKGKANVIVAIRVIVAPFDVHLKGMHPHMMTLRAISLKQHWLGTRTFGCYHTLCKNCIMN